MLKEYMLELGYTKEEINKIINMYPICECNEDTVLRYVKNIFKFLRKLDLNDNEIKRMTVRFPQLFVYSNETLSKKIEMWMEFGFNKENLKSIFKKNPRLVGLKIDSVSSKINDMVELGYKYEEVIKMIKKFPNVFGYNLSKKIEEIMSIGYTYDQVISMTYLCCALFSYSIDNMKLKIDTIMELGFSREQVLHMTVDYPTLFCISVDNIRAKYAFYDSIGITEFMIKEPKRLIQSVELSYARYMFYDSIGQELKADNYSMLFIKQNQFIKHYGKTNKELTEEYKYSEYIERVNNKKLYVKKD